MQVLITGAAGFIGCNAARRFLRRGAQVIAVDNLSRPGTRQNLAWLRTLGDVRFFQADLRDDDAIETIVGAHRDVDAILHLAGQVAVTRSVDDPRADFDANAFGTLNLLEALRGHGVRAPLLFSSTNKVYGAFEDHTIVERDGRHVLRDLPLGVSETTPTDFHSPYGCSKGAADQYVRDYYRIYGIPTVVFRQSCIYGDRQLGMEDQGWVAWLMLAHDRGRPITIYGDGKQTRDVLFIDDLLDAYDAAIARIADVAGRIYNIGGGPSNTISLLDVVDYLQRRSGRRVDLRFAAPRPGDQRSYVSDIRRAAADLQWRPTIDWPVGLDRLYESLCAPTPAPVRAATAAAAAIAPERF